MVAFVGTALGQDAAPVGGTDLHPVNVYYFWGNGCPVCVQQRAYLDQLEARYGEVSVHAFEVWYDAENLALLQAFSDAFRRPVTGVPVTFIGEDSWVGFNALAGQQMTSSVEAYRRYAAPDAADRLHGDVRDALLTTEAPPPVAARPGDAAIDIPFVGIVDLSHQPLLVGTLLIAFVDGFNPCSLWVLALLLGVVINTRSRTKVLLVGVTFLGITALVYGLFIAGMFSVFSYVAYLTWIRVVVALLALGFALVNIKDYFAYKQGISFTIGDEHKPGIYARMRGIMSARGSIPATLAATGGLALGVTLVELPCTAGLPVLWTTLLAGAGVDTTGFIALLAVYIVVYLMLELLIFGGVVVTMRVGRFEEREGRILKLIGGAVMLALAFAMLAMPHLLESIGGMLLLFGAALGGSLMIVVLHRIVHPASSPLTQARAPARAVGSRARGRPPKASG
jgi:cytochrome c biogenesis protein CcdA/thiol-disulfide isomerase/thioredoxin